MQYEVNELKIVDVLAKISIPNYQRHLVWPQKNKKRFIESLILEYPIGVITAYEKELALGKQIIIIDGLQRLSTINQFFSKPSSIINYPELVKLLNIEVKDTYSGLTNSQNKFIHNYFQKWYSELCDINVKLEISEFKFMMQMQKNYNEVFNSSDLEPFAEQILNRFNAIVKAILFMNSSIPFIICKDIEDEELPIVFESMNTGSVKLSKYEIYVSQWHNYGSLNVSDNKILKEIVDLKKQRYEKIFNQSVEELEPEQLMDFNTIYLQDILIYYSMLLFEGLEISKKRADELSFEILSLVCSNKVYGINNLIFEKFILNDKFKDGTGDYIIKLFEHILSICSNESTNFSTVHKFKKYFILSVLFNLTAKIDIENQLIETEELTQEMILYIENVNDDFENNRQVSYLHSLIYNTTKLFYQYNVSTDNIPTAKVVNITHAGRPHPEDKLRIQVVPARLRGDRNRGYYSEIFGLYDGNATNESVYVKFNFEHSINSNAKNKSIYVQYEDLKAFQESNNSIVRGIDEFVDEIMTEEMFNSNYLKY